jgi:hypothetical protein
MNEVVAEIRLLKELQHCNEIGENRDSFSVVQTLSHVFDVFFQILSLVLFPEALVPFS